MAKELYIYPVMRTHLQERSLLSQSDIDEMAASKNVAGVYQVLQEKGWSQAGVQDAQALIAAQQKHTWAFVEEALGDLTPFDVFRYANDYHNLKAAIKMYYSGESEAYAGRYLIQNGTIDPAVIQKAVKEHDYSALPARMAQAGKEAYEVLAQTGNGQNCDMIMDRAALIAIHEAGENAESRLLKEYARITVDCANIKAAIRCCLMKKERGFIERAVAPCGTLDTSALVDAAAQSIETVYEFLKMSAYAEAIGHLKRSMAAFERWCDDRMIDMIRPQKNNFYTIEPLAAYILARENEIRMVKLILSAKINGLSTDALKERLREMYV
ncbi:MAG: V-type ATPase subunit [Christensenellales bacterium]|jgi:V/A-type H+-transporting ATPase subunit C